MSLEELREALESFLKDYSIYENMYEEETKAFEYIDLDEIDNTTVFYYYVEDETTNEWCNICEAVF